MTSYTLIMFGQHARNCESWRNLVIQSSGFEGLSPFFSTLQASLPFFQLGTIGIPHPDTKRCAWILPSWLLRKRTVAGWFLSEIPKIEVPWWDTDMTCVFGYLRVWDCILDYRCIWMWVQPGSFGLPPLPNLLTGGVLVELQQPWPKRQRSPCRRPIAEKGSMDGWSPWHWPNLAERVARNLFLLVDHLSTWDVSRICRWVNVPAKAKFAISFAICTNLKSNTFQP
jgi:hypothetical protein